jgi:hypothetical protein
MASDKKKRISFFGPPPLLAGEDPETYNQLLAGVTDCVAPSDFLEEIWVNDIVGLTWDVIRWRRIQTAVLNNGMPDAFVKLQASPLLPGARRLMRAWIAGKSADVKRAKDLLASVGMTIDNVQGRAMELKLEPIDGVERLIASAEIRRSAIFREIDRHRDRKQFAKTLRTKIAEIEDAEFEEVTTAPPQQPSGELPSS